MIEKKNKHVYLMLTRSGMPISSTMQKLDLGYYTHSCLAFDKELRYMYSFGTLYLMDPFHTGLKKESIYRDFYVKKPYIPVLILEICVTEKQYYKMLNTIRWVRDHHDRFKFNTIGMLLSFFNIDHERPGYYFCSEFIYTLFKDIGIMDLHKPRHYVLPDDFIKANIGEVTFQGQLITLQSKLAPFHGKIAEPYLFENSPRYQWSAARSIARNEEKEKAKNSKLKQN